MDPITTLIVTAIALGASAGLKPAAEQAVKDAYAGLKKVILDRYKDHRTLANAVAAMDESPGDAGRQAALEQQLIEAGAHKDPVLAEAAAAVHVAGAAQGSRRKILGTRLQRKLKQVEALENQRDLTLDDGQKVILEEKAQALWVEIGGLEAELAAITARPGA
jgi:effector-associated domain 9 (EAD9)-containing protein